MLILDYVYLLSTYYIIWSFHLASFIQIQPKRYTFNKTLFFVINSEIAQK
jgi:hypothetical protein